MSDEKNPVILILIRSNRNLRLKTLEDSVIRIWAEWRKQRFTDFLALKKSLKYVMGQSILMGAKLSEYHTGYRGFSRELLEKVPFHANSDDFVFDNQMRAQVLWLGYTVAEVSCPTRYFSGASSINFQRSIIYGVGCLKTACEYRLAKMKVIESRLFPGGKHCRQFNGD